MINIKKIKKTSFTLFVIISILLLWFLIDNIRVIAFEPMQWTPFSVASTIIGVLMVLAILIVALVLLYSIKKDESPFNTENVMRLKIIACLLALIELHFFISQWIFHRFFPIILNDNIAVVTRTSQGGCILAGGVIVYCVALIFEYGIALQTQFDETL